MGIPSGFAFHFESALCFETADSVLYRTCHYVMNAGDAVCGRRTFIKYKLTLAVHFTHASVECIILIPYPENILIHFRKIKTFIFRKPFPH